MLRRLSAAVEEEKQHRHDCSKQSSTSQKWVLTDTCRSHLRVCESVNVVAFRARVLGIVMLGPVEDP